MKRVANIRLPDWLIQVEVDPRSLGSPIWRSTDGKRERNSFVGAVHQCQQVYITATHVFVALNRSRNSCDDMNMMMISRKALHHGTGIFDNEHNLDFVNQTARYRAESGFINYANRISTVNCRRAKEVVLFTSTPGGVKERYLPVATQNHILYLFSQKKLHVLVVDQNPVEIVSNMLIFETRSRALALCRLNKWIGNELPLLTLFLGLRFRELGRIEESLTLLDFKQEMDAIRMISSYIQNGYSIFSCGK